MSASLKMIAVFATSAGVVAVITAITGFWALVSWAAPIAPTLYLATALFVVFIVMGGIWFVVTRRELARGVGVDGASAEERGLQRLVGLGANVVLGVLALAVVAMWNLAAVRSEFVARRVTHIELEAVLGDPSPVVRLRACEELFQRGWVFRSKQALVAALDPEPALATKCLQTAKENNWAGFVSLASDLNSGWTAAMMSAGAAEAPSACEKAPWSPVLSELSEERPDVRLLRCATGAASDDVRQCCANTLSRRGPLLEQLGPPAQFPPDATEQVFPALLAHAFQPLTLSSGQQQVVATLHMDDESVRRWAVELGCWAVDPERAQTKMIGAMYPLIEAETCGLSPAEESLYRSANAWARLCEQVLSDDSGKHVQESICVGVRDARAIEATEVARVEVRRAIRAPFLERDAKFLQSGLNDAFRMGGEEESLRAEAEANRHRMTVSDVMGRSSSKFRGDLTVGEFVRKHQARHEQLQKDIANPMQSKDVQQALKRARDERSAARNAQKEFGSALQVVHDNKK